MSAPAGKRCASNSSSEEKTGEVEDEVKINLNAQPFEVDIRITRARGRARRMELPDPRFVDLPSGIGWRGRTQSAHFTRTVARTEGRVLDEIRNMSLPPTRRPPTKKHRSRSVKPPAAVGGSTPGEALQSDGGSTPGEALRSDGESKTDDGTRSTDYESTNVHSRFNEPANTFTVLHSQNTENVAASSPDIVCFTEVHITESLKRSLNEAGYEVLYKRSEKDRAVGLCFLGSNFECMNNFTVNVSSELRKVVQGVSDIDPYITPERFAVMAILRHLESGLLVKVVSSQSAARTETLQLLQDTAILEHMMKLNNTQTPVILCGQLDPANTTLPQGLFVKNVLFRSICQEDSKFQGANGVNVYMYLYTFFSGQGLRLVKVEKMEPDYIVEFETVPKPPRSAQGRSSEMLSGPDEITAPDASLDGLEDNERDLSLVEELTDQNMRTLYNSVCCILFTDGDGHMISLAKDLLQEAAEDYANVQASYVGRRYPLPEIRFLFAGNQINDIVGAIRRELKLEGPKVMLAIVDAEDMLSYRLQDPSITNHNIRNLIEKFLNLSCEFLPICF